MLGTPTINRIVVVMKGVQPEQCPNGVASLQNFI